VLVSAGVFSVFTNLAADQDVLVSVADGMNAHDPTDPGFVPNVSISYGHLTDASITNATAAGDPALEGDAYLAHADPGNGCAYPIACAVGARRQVTGYTLNNGADGARHFAVRYRDGRYHRLGRGFLGFGERIVVDLDTGAGAADFYDNQTSITVGGAPAFPFAGQVVKEWLFYPGLPSQPQPDQIEVAIAGIGRTTMPTNGGQTYLALTNAHRIIRAQGTYPDGMSPTVLAYVANIATGVVGGVYSDATASFSDFDPFGSAQSEDVSAVGVDLTVHVDRTFKNDTSAWVLGQLQTQKECSSAAMLSQCRTLARNTTAFGEVHDDTLGSDEGIPDTQLSVVYDRDAFGNVTTITADDAFGHHRTLSTTFDDDAIYPKRVENGAHHVSLPKYDPGLGVLVQLTDPNQLVTTWGYDSLGRMGLEKRPDGTQRVVKRARTKDGGPLQDAWRVTQETTITGGADDTVEYDARGRPIRWWWHGPNPAAGSRPRIVQEIVYDTTGDHVAKRSVPTSEGTPASGVLYDVFERDAVGREVRHTTPWGAPMLTAYNGSAVVVTDPLSNVTTTEKDSLGRPVKVTDAKLGVTQYGYGPFGSLHTVIDPGGAVTTTLRDAFGRVRELDDPDRGATKSQHDGFGELISSTDALGRMVTLDYDALGRITSRLDQNGAESLSTTWTWDTAPHGVGMLADVKSPDADKSYTYTSLSQLHTIALAVQGKNAALRATLGYDPAGRVATITYPTPAGAAPFSVIQDYDAYGHVIEVRDGARGPLYWSLTDVDDAGRYRQEAFGNGVTTTRSWFADKQSLESIVTKSATTTVQDLAYAYDDRLDLESRTDALQTQNTTERFRYDELERLTCAYFSPTENVSAPCALSYGYAANGNLTSKSDVGPLTYNDATHPHAVTGAGTDAFGYDRVGNQTARPGGTTVSYTPFDLPKTITTGAQTVAAFGYDGDEKRVRKATPGQETIYFGELYEHVTDLTAPGTAGVDRFYVRSPERVVAVVTRGGPQAGTLYVHPDHLGSVETLTNNTGVVVEKRSYDPFGQRRNATWGQPPPASFPSLTTVGFTGHESDDDLGLVNMKGRVFDPKVGRFLTTDSIVADPLDGQSYNPYSYVFNNPLSLVDPSGFEPDEPDGIYIDDKKNKEVIKVTNIVEKKRDTPNASAAPVGAEKRPNDTNTTGPGAQPPPKKDDEPKGLTWDPPPIFPRTLAAAAPLGAPGLPAGPVGLPGAPGVGPLNAPGPFVPNAFAPGSFVEPLPPGTVPLEAPGAPTVPAEAPGVTVGGVLGSVVFILTVGAIVPGDVRLHPPGPTEYEVVPYKDKASGFQNHHGVLDKWAAENIPGYRSRAPDSPTIRLTVEHHRLTVAEYRQWLTEQTGKPVGGHVDWKGVSAQQILDLSERLFNAADVPHAAREEYYRNATKYFYENDH
jgi:RHS repeat-associated protein